MPLSIDDGDSTQIKPDDLVGLLLGEAIKKYVILDLNVKAASSGAIEYDFERTEFNRVYNRSLWPIHLPADDLASKFVRGGGDLDASIPEEVKKVAELMINRYAKLVGYLCDGSIVAIDMNNNHVDQTIWRGPDLAIDIHKSHLYEIPGVTRWRQGYNNSGNRLLSSRLRLSHPERRTAGAVRSLGPEFGTASVYRRRKPSQRRSEAVAALKKYHGIGTYAEFVAHRESQSFDYRRMIDDVPSYGGKKATAEQQEAFRVLLTRLFPQDFPAS
jgi:hypothetical protein